MNDLIVQYWNRRATLGTAEWVELYRLLVPLLMRTRLPDEYGDERKRRDLVHCFFQDKVFLNAATSMAGPLQNVHALHGYLKNYELDLRRGSAQLVALDEAAAAAGCASLDELPDPRPHEAHAGILRDAGIDIGTAMRSARDFLDDEQALRDGEVALLRDHTCADEDAAEPVSAIARRWAMGSSYHYQAKVLGITREKGATYHGYGKSKIGAWLLSVGAQLNEDWREEIAALLIVLCLQVGAHPRGRMA